ncbi:hypothetical protein J6590_053151 [Homalodisca vitripennis]|nr:hypothetical protein J6590_053151 [Homalodisca vitripennis]
MMIRALARPSIGRTGTKNKDRASFKTQGQTSPARRGPTVAVPRSGLKRPGKLTMALNDGKCPEKSCFLHNPSIVKNNLQTKNEVQYNSLPKQPNFNWQCPVPIAVAAGGKGRKNAAGFNRTVGTSR